MTLFNLSKRWTLRISSVLGVLAAFGIVLAWFPHVHSIWNLPIQQIDAPAHYYFIRKILNEGLGAATHLWPNDAYYPPFFHLLAAGLIKVAGIFGVTVNIYTAFNIVWLTTSGLVWPAGMQALARYWISRVGPAQDSTTSDNLKQKSLLDSLKHPPSTRGWASSEAFACVMALIVPVISVASACHPFWMLAAGPLVAFGLATSLLPFFLAASLRLLDAIASKQRVVVWLGLTAFTGLLCVFAQPRIIFTWFLFMLPFVVLRMPWKWIAGMVLAAVLGAGAFFVYMTATYKSSRYFDPSSWFHTFVPNRSVGEALRIVVTENIPGVAGVLMALVVVAALIVSFGVAVKPNCVYPLAGQTARDIRKDAIALISVFLLVGLVYICSTALTGWFANIVAAPWYRAETRPLTMIPLGVLPMIIFALCMLASVRTRSVEIIGDSTEMPNSGIETVADGVPPVCITPDRRRVPAISGLRSGLLIRWISVAIVAVLAVGAQINNGTRNDLSTYVGANTVLNNAHPDEQLTLAKYQVLQQVVGITGDKAVIISDPLNGSMYGATLFDANMFFPIYNPMAEGNGAIFPKVENAFNSGNAEDVLNTVCPIGAETPEYFLTLGSQAPSLQMFTFKAQFDTFHSTTLIDEYVRNGTLIKVRDFTSHSTDGSDWALYRFGCAQ